MNRGNRSYFIDSRAQLVKIDLCNKAEEALQEKILKDCSSYGVIIDFLSFSLEHLKRILSILDNFTVYNKKNDDESLTEQSEIGNEKWDFIFNKDSCEGLLKKSAVNYTIIRSYVIY